MAFARLLREINLRDLRGSIAGLMRQTRSATGSTVGSRRRTA
jgi:hypothetical protein